jgi:hypothetical protein
MKPFPHLFCLTHNMLTVIAFLFLVFAFCLFAIEAWRTKELIAAGLACWTLSLILVNSIIGAH